MPTTLSSVPQNSFESSSQLLYDSLYSVIDADPSHAYTIFTKKMAHKNKSISRKQFETVFKVIIASLIVWAVLGSSFFAGACIALTAYSVFVLDTQYFENGKKPSVDAIAATLWGHMKTFAATAIAAKALRTLPKNFG